MSARKRAYGLDFDLFDLDDLNEAVLLSVTAAGFTLLIDGDVAVELRGAFTLGGEDGALPTGGTVTGFRLIDDGDVKLSLNGLSLDMAELLRALAASGRAQDDAADEDDEEIGDDPNGLFGGEDEIWSDGDSDGWQSGDDRLLDLFDVDPIQTGRLRRVEEDRFQVDWWGAVAVFEGDFVLSTKGVPMSGRITSFQLREGREVERELSRLDVDLADLLAAMARDEGLNWPPRDWTPAEPRDADPLGGGLLAALLGGDDSLREDAATTVWAGPPATTRSGAAAATTRFSAATTTTA